MMSQDFTTNTILMIKPTKFGFNSESALDNIYQKKELNFSAKEIRLQAQNEFCQLVSLLKDEGLEVIEFIDNTNDNTPDSLFPNNWISTHKDGTIYLYSMFAKNRRLERRTDIINYFKKNFQVKNIINNAEFYEKKGLFLEGTGSMVLDRENKIAYACLSKRTEFDLFSKWCIQMKYRCVSFCAKDKEHDIYHTNVLMSICKYIVFICLDAILEETDKDILLSMFKKTNKEIINISSLQMNSFLGNVLELKNSNKESLLIMSSSAYNSLTSDQFKIITRYMKIIHSPLNFIESFGGGSARCMIAEIFLRKSL